jgi:hypothetical protein
MERSLGSPILPFVPVLSFAIQLSNRDEYPLQGLRIRLSSALLPRSNGGDGNKSGGGNDGGVDDRTNLGDEEILQLGESIDGDSKDGDAKLLE